jgi:hypothetical protein
MIIFICGRYIIYVLSMSTYYHPRYSSKRNEYHSYDGWLQGVIINPWGWCLTTENGYLRLKKMINRNRWYIDSGSLYRKIISPKMFDRKVIWSKVHMTESFFQKMVIWPKGHLADSSFDRMFFRKMVIRPKKFLIKGEIIHTGS